MKNGERFVSLIDGCLERNPLYENELGNLKNYLDENELLDKAFNLNETHIDAYFVYSFIDKIGAESTLNAHIAALKALFSYLIENEYDFKRLNVYISDPGFRQKLSKSLDSGTTKGLISSEQLTEILTRLDKKINSEFDRSQLNKSDTKRVAERLISRLFIKLSLLIPLRASEILDLSFFESMIIDRHVDINGIKVKLTDGLVEDIKSTMEYYHTHYGLEINGEVKLFHELFRAIGSTSGTRAIRDVLVRTYQALELTEMLIQKKVGQKSLYLYPPESYKKTAILSLLENGTNIVYLKKLTGLDMNSLVGDMDFEASSKLIDIKSQEINSGLVNTSYYSFL